MLNVNRNHIIPLTHWWRNVTNWEETQCASIQHPNMTVTSLQFKQFDFIIIPVSSKRDARQVDSENPMEDRSSFPAAGKKETEGSKLGRSEEGPKHLSSRCPCRLRSTQLQRAQALTVSLNKNTKQERHSATLYTLLKQNNSVKSNGTH